jgi:hypothetical protein
VSAPKFTPGPWRYNDLSIYTDDANARDRVIIAELCGPGVTAEKRVEYRANGALIASAPALYSALRMIVESHDATCPGESCGIMGIDLARAALARARGEVNP